MIELNTKVSCKYLLIWNVGHHAIVIDIVNILRTVHLPSIRLIHLCTLQLTQYVAKIHTNMTLLHVVCFNSKTNIRLFYCTKSSTTAYSTEFCLMLFLGQNFYCTVTAKHRQSILPVLTEKNCSLSIVKFQLFLLDQHLS